MIFNRKNLIVSADDFGISHLANNNILILAEAGKLDRVSIMTHGIFSKAEITRLQKSGVQLDIHFDLKNSIPENRKLKESVFLRIAEFILKYPFKYSNTAALESQWKKQLGKFHSLFGKNPDGINSHQHIHFFPPFFKIIVSLAQEKNIGFIRFGKKNLIKSQAKTYFILHGFRKIDLRNFNASSLDSSDYMFSLDWSDDLSKTLCGLPNGTIEIACHPERKEEFETIKKYF